MRSLVFTGPVVFLMICVVSSHAFDIRDVVWNGSFESGVSADSTRPCYWYIGFPDEPSIDSLGTWQLDESCSASGEFSLKLTPEGSVGDGYSVTQILDAPTFDLEGKAVTLSVHMKVTDPAGAHTILFALNPEAPDTSGLGPNVGYVMITPEMADTALVEYSGSFTASGPAALMAVALLVEPWCEAAWFDDVSVVFDVAEPGNGPDTSEVMDPLMGEPRDFYIGTVSEIARNSSEAAYGDLPEDIAEIGDIINVFAHIQWNSLRGQSPINGHEAEVALSQTAASLGLERMLTLDFTHNSFEVVGDINPMPDGTPVAALTPEVRSAYIDELVVLVAETEPRFVSVGIEASIFYSVRPDQWENYILLMEEARSALASYPDLHVTSYFCLDDMIDDQGNFRQPVRDAWEEIMPYCDSVAYSFYPDLSDTMFFAMEDYFAVPKALAPDKPLLIPEFGIRSDTTQGFSEVLQNVFMSHIVSEVAETEPSPAALIWFAMYDFQYLGAPQWAKDAFATLGLRDYAGTPKLAHAAFRTMRDNAAEITSQPAPSHLSLTVSPNPFSSRCFFMLGPELGQSRIEIYDVAGHRVDSLPVLPSQRRLSWHAADLPSGIYIARLFGQDVSAMRRIVLLH